MKTISLFRAALLLFVLAQGLYFTMAWFVPQGLDFGGLHVAVAPKWLTPQQVAALTPGPLAVAVLANLPVLLLSCYAAWRLNALLRALSRGELFAAATIGHLRAFAGAALGAMLSSVLDTLLRGLAWRYGFRSTASLDIGVSSEELLAMLVCLLFFVIAGLMREGRRLAEENEGFV